MFRLPCSSNLTALANNETLLYPITKGILSQTHMRDFLRHFSDLKPSPKTFMDNIPVVSL